MLLALVGCNSEKLITLSDDEVSDNVQIIKPIYSVVFDNFSFNDADYRVAILPVSSEHPSGYCFTHSSNLEKVATFQIEQADSSLHFYTQEACQLTGGSFLLSIYANIEYLTIDGGIACELSGVNHDLEITVQGAASITTPSPIDLNLLRCQVSGAATLAFNGTCESATYSIEGTAAIKAADFITKTTVVDIEGAGSAEVYASESFQGSVKGTGSITYHGNPGKVVKSVEGLGSIQSA